MSKALTKFIENDALVLNDHYFDQREYTKKKYLAFGNQWFHKMLQIDDRRLDNILQFWKLRSPGKEIEKDIKECLNISKKEYTSPILFLVFVTAYAYSYNKFTLRRLKNIFNNMIYFGADLLMQDKNGNFHYGVINSFPYYWVKELDDFRKIYNKAVAGQKIVRYVKKALNDEIYLTELRKKIDLRKYLEIEESSGVLNKKVVKKSCLL